MSDQVKKPLFITKLFKRLRRWYRLHILKDPVTRWFADKGDSTLRLNYPSLNQSSVVFDLGGYLGDFAYQINQKYSCKVYVFEPHPAFYDKCVQRFSGNDSIVPLNFGIAEKSGQFTLSDSVDASSFLNPTQQAGGGVECELREFFAVASDLGVDHIDLMKINIEGGEYPLLQHIADNDKLGMVEDYQVQFHDFIESAESKRDRIATALRKTHTRTWCYRFVWENWKKT